MKKQIASTLVLLLLSLISFSQVSKQQKKAEKEFLQQLNSILKQKNMPHHWQYEHSYEIVQPFQIDSNMLSLSLRYKNDSSWFVHRMIMPVKSIESIGWDMYVILESGSKDVLVYDSPVNSAILQVADTRSLFHVAQVDDEVIYEKLKKSWEKLAPFYSNENDQE